MFIKEIDKSSNKTRKNYYTFRFCELYRIDNKIRKENFKWLCDRIEKKRMKNLIIILFLVSSFVLNAQTNNNDYKNVDEKIAQSSIAINNNAVGELVEFINNNFSTETDKLRAAFVWITTNFEYDVENMFAIKFYNEAQELINLMLKNKKGICSHFAYLFSEIGNKLGIKTYLISGYTKQRGFVDYIPHAWCASLVDSTWYLFDPTWGTGYIQKHQFIKKQNDFYFKTQPKDLIRSHMPFDPLWQFLYYPISAQEFYLGNTTINEDKPIFNYIDTLKVYENETKIEQLISANNRIEQNGVKNTLTYNQLENNSREIEHYKNKIVVDSYNSAANFYNEGVYSLNRFIDFRNKQFTPQKTEIEIRKMVETADSLFINSQNKLQQIITTDINTINSINQLKLAIVEAKMQIKEQKNFIDTYFNTKKLFRKSLFYKYTWFGIPLN